MIYRILWGIDALVALVFVYFFVVGLADGSVSSFNMTLWLTILVGLGALLGGAFKLKSAGHAAAAVGLLLLLAIPSLVFGVFMLALILGNPDWK